MKTREEYWYWMLQNIKFNREDRRFMHGVYENRIYKNQTITPKQADLWELLVYKYRRQIQQQNLDPDAVLSAAWQQAPEPPQPDHTTSTVSLAGDQLIVRSPYNKDQVERWRRLRMERNMDDAVWEQPTKQWIIPLTVTNLKTVLDFCHPTFEIDPAIWSMITGVTAGTRAEHWQTQARLVQGRVMVSPATEALLSALPDQLPVTLDTLSRLSRAGVDIHETLIQACGQEHAADLVKLNSERRSALPWNQDSYQAILDYLQQHEHLTVTAETANEPGPYQQLIQEIQQRWPQRLITYGKKSYQVESLTEISDYDFSDIDFSQGIDILINKTCNLIGWGRGFYPALAAKKIIYYIDPEHNRSDYLQESPLL